MTPDTYKPIMQVSVIPTDKKADIGLDDHFGQNDHIDYQKDDHLDQKYDHFDQKDHLNETDQFGHDDQDDRVGQDDHVEQDGQDDNVDDIGRSLKIKWPLFSNWRFMLLSIKRNVLAKCFKIKLIFFCYKKKQTSSFWKHSVGEHFIKNKPLISEEYSAT